jgi:2-phospho-L-lactate guanylyltransferase
LDEALTWRVVVPVKGTARSKSRLNASNELAAAIAIDTVSAALDAASVLVVTSAEAAPAFSALGVEVILDRGEGLNSAIALGITSAGSGPVAVLLGDLPALVPEELTSVLEQALSYPRAMVADADGRGTTLITATPGSSLRPAFGPDSRAAHLAAGYEEITRSSTSGLRRDVDTADQLNVLARAGRLGPKTTSVWGATHIDSESAAFLPGLIPVA